MADNVTLARSLYEAWNDRNFDRAAASVTPDAKITIIGSGDTFEGPEGIRKYDLMWAEAFPDGQITIDRVIAQGDHVVVEFTGRGTHTGTLVTPAGSIAATGRSVTLQLCDVLEISDGLVSSQRTYFDAGSLMAQLGLTVEQAATAQQQ
jgi:predicted ester cyclase